MPPTLVGANIDTFIANARIAGAILADNAHERPGRDREGDLPQHMVAAHMARRLRDPLSREQRW